MTSSQDGTSLLASLKHLYSRVMTLHAEARARSSLNLSKKASSQNIVSPLSECIDKLAASAVNTPVNATNSQIPEEKDHSHNHTNHP